MNRSRLYATEAIVLRRTDTGEADRLVTLLTPGRGRLRVVAKGARKLTSRKAGHIELFNKTRVMLARGATFDLITQAELIEPYLPLREDMLRGGLAHHFAELTDQFAREEHEDAPLFGLLSDGLTWLCTASDPTLAARYFEMRLLMLGGYRPELNRCALTGAPLESDANPEDPRGTPFSPADGGALCRAALGQARQWTTLSRSGLLLMRGLVSQGWATLAALEVPAQTHTEVERALQAALAEVTERRGKSIGVVKRAV
jgi:DNA repair protein RecO (recombination protein O)